MSQSKPLVVVTRKLPGVIETRMMELFDVELNLADTPLSKSALIEAVARADVLVPTVTDRIDSAVLAKAGPKLKLIANYGTGIDHIDLAAARQRGITVTNTPDVLTEDTADMTMALILAVPRRLAEGERVMRGGIGPAGHPHGCSGAGSTASAWASLGWAGSGRQSPAGRGGSGCPSITITATGYTAKRKRNWKRPIGKASIKCWRAWISFP